MVTWATTPGRGSMSMTLSNVVSSAGASGSTTGGGTSCGCASGSQMAAVMCTRCTPSVMSTPATVITTMLEAHTTHCILLALPAIVLLRNLQHFLNHTYVPVITR